MSITITPLPQTTVDVNKTIEATLGDFLLEEAEKEEANLYAIVDSARNDRVFRYLIIGDVTYRSLFEGTMDVQSYGVSGFVVECKKDSSLFKWLTTDIRGQDACMFFTCKSSFDEVFNHFQKFNRVILEGNQVVLFRFYDPRVLKTYLPTCNKKEIDLFFGEVKSFFAESEEAEVISKFIRVDEKQDEYLSVTN